MNTGSNLHSGHRKRVKARFMLEGLDGFTDHQILELLLFYSIPQIDTNEIAHKLLLRFGSLPAVLEAPVEELTKVDGIGENSATLLHLIPALSRCYRMGKLLSPERSEKNERPMELDDIGRYFAERLGMENEEKVLLLLLDNAGRMIGCEELLNGSPGSVPVDVRKMLEVSISKKAASVVIAHNHPCGKLRPSEADIDATLRLSKILFSAGIRLREHILVVGESWLPLRILMEKRSGMFGQNNTEPSFSDDVEVFYPTAKGFMFSPSDPDAARQRDPRWELFLSDSDRWETAERALWRFEDERS